MTIQPEKCSQSGEPHPLLVSPALRTARALLLECRDLLAEFEPKVLVVGHSPSCGTVKNGWVGQE